MTVLTLDRLLVPLETVPGYVHGIVSLDPPTVQCDGCGLTVPASHLNLLILTCGIEFDTHGGDGRRLCRECRGAA